MRLSTIIGVLAFLWFFGVFDNDDDKTDKVIVSITQAVDTMSKTVKEFEQKHKDSIETFKQKVDQTAERMEQKQKDIAKKYEQKPVVSNEQELQIQELFTYEEWEQQQKTVIQ